MKLPLDTHALLWFIAGSSSFSSLALESVEDISNEEFVSIASVWETAIKVSIGKIAISEPFGRLFPHQLNINGFEVAPIRIEHAAVVSDLPFHHRDPFDRLIAVQAIHEDLTVVNVDSVFDDYGVNRLW